MGMHPDVNLIGMILACMILAGTTLIVVNPVGIYPSDATLAQAEAK